MGEDFASSQEGAIREGGGREKGRLRQAFRGMEGEAGRQGKRQRERRRRGRGRRRGVKHFCWARSCPGTCRGHSRRPGMHGLAFLAKALPECQTHIAVLVYTFTSR